MVVCWTKWPERMNWLSCHMFWRIKEFIIGILAICQHHLIERRKEMSRCYQLQKCFSVLVFCASILPLTDDMLLPINSLYQLIPSDISNDAFLSLSVVVENKFAFNWEVPILNGILILHSLIWTLQWFSTQICVFKSLQFKLNHSHFLCTSHLYICLSVKTSVRYEIACKESKRMLCVPKDSFAFSITQPQIFVSFNIFF